MKEPKTYLLPSILFIFGFTLNLSLLSKGPYHNDTLWLVMEAEKILKTGELSYNYGPGYILTTITGILFIILARLFNIEDPIWAVNCMSAVFGAMCLPAFYLLTKKFFDTCAALFGSLLLLSCPIFLALSTYGKNHTQAYFFILTTFLFLNNFRESPGHKSLILAGVFAGLLGATRMSDLGLMFPVFSIFMSLGNSPRTPQDKIRNIFCFGIMALFTCALFFVPLALNYSHEPAQYLRGMWTDGVRGNFRGFLSPSLSWSAKYIMTTLSPVGFILTLQGFVHILRNNVRQFIFLISWFLVPISFYGNLYSTVPRFLMISLFPLIMAEGFYLARLFQWPKRHFRSAVLVIFLLVVFVSMASILPILTIRHKNEFLPDFARWVASKTEPNAEIISVDHHLFLEYYGRRKNLPHPGRLFSIDKTELERFKVDLDGKLARGIPIYTTEAGLYAEDPNGEFSNFIKSHYDLDFIGREPADDWHGGETIAQYGKMALFRILPKAN